MVSRRVLMARSWQQRLLGFYENSKGPCAQIVYTLAYFGLNVVPIQVRWGQSICYLGTWTLRENGDHFGHTLHHSHCQHPGMAHPCTMRVCRLLTAYASCAFARTRRALFSSDRGFGGFRDLLALSPSPLGSIPATAKRHCNSAR